MDNRTEVAPQSQDIKKTAPQRNQPERNREPKPRPNVIQANQDQANQISQTVAGANNVETIELLEALISGNPVVDAGISTLRGLMKVLEREVKVIRGRNKDARTRTIQQINNSSRNN